MTVKKSKKQLKAIILSNIMVLGLSFVMLATMSYAWFISAWNVDAPHEMNVGIFKVNFTESGKAPITDSTTLITIDPAYPSTFEKQTAVGNVYTFEIQNNGTISAQFRLSAQVVADSGYIQGSAPTVGGKYPLSEQIRFAVKIYGSAQPVPADWTDGGLLFASSAGSPIIPTPPTPPKPSFKQYFNSRLLSPNAGKTEYFGKDLGVIVPTPSIPPTSPTTNYKVTVKLLLWLDENATIESTGAVVTSGVSPILKFKIVMTAAQSGGGYGFPAKDIADLSTEKDPSGVA